MIDIFTAIWMAGGFGLTGFVYGVYRGIKHVQHQAVRYGYAEYINEKFDWR